MYNWKGENNDYLQMMDLLAIFSLFILTLYVFSKFSVINISFIS